MNRPHEKTTNTFLRLRRARLASLVLVATCGATTAFVACSNGRGTPFEEQDGNVNQADAAVVDSGGPPDNWPSTDASDDAEVGWTLTLAEWVLAKKQSPLPPVPPSPGNKYADNPAAAVLGQQFYFDKGVAGPISQSPNDLGALNEPGKVSCASCHVTPWGTDTRSFPNALSLGTSWSTRNTPPIVNVAFYVWFYWDGRTDSLWQQALQAGENVLQQNSDRLRITRRIYAKYRTEYEAVFGAADGPLDPRFDPSSPGAFPLTGKPGVAAYDALPAADQTIITRTFVNWGKSIEAYERLLVSRNAPWDQFVAGNPDAITQAAIHGYKLFTSKGYCINCHSGPLFSDSKLHNIGVADRGQIVDRGRYDTIVKAIGNKFRADGIWSDDADAGARKLSTQFDFDAGLFPDGTPAFSMTAELGMWRTKHLRQITYTAPYMHNGSLYSLQEVMRLYNRGGGDSGVGKLDIAFDGHIPMSQDEESDVIEFMKTLTGDEPPAALLTDTSKP